MQNSTIKTIFLRASILSCIFTANIKPYHSTDGSEFLFLMPAGLAVGYLLTREPNESICNKAEVILSSYKQSNMSHLLTLSNIKDIKQQAKLHSAQKANFSLLKDLNDIHSRIHNRSKKPWNHSNQMTSMSARLDKAASEAKLIDILMKYSAIIDSTDISMATIYHHATLAKQENSWSPLRNAHDQIKSALEMIEKTHYQAHSPLYAHLTQLKTLISQSSEYAAEMRARETQITAEVAYIAACCAQANSYSRK